MSETWQSIENRGQSTVGVWSTFNAAFTVGEVTLASHSTDVSGLAPLAQLVVDQDTVVNAARAARDVDQDLVEDMNIRLPKKLSAELPKGDPLHHDIELLRAIRPETQNKNMERGQKVLSVWKKFNLRQTTSMPAKPVLTVGGITVESFGASLAQLVPNDQTVEDALGERRKRNSALFDAMEKVDMNNKRWYGSWGAEYPVGTPEHDALAQIDTGTTTSEPTPIEIASVVFDSANAVTVTYVPGGGVHATTQIVQFRTPLDADFGNDLAIIEPSQQIVENAFIPAGTYVFRTICSNSSGVSESAEVSVTK